MAFYPVEQTFSYQTPPRLVKSILLYGDAHTVRHATLHDVQQDNNEHALSAGVTLSPVEVKRLLEQISGHTRSNEQKLIPDKVLSFGDEHLLWWVKGKPGDMWFKVNRELPVRYHVPYPNLVFLAIKGKLFVCAVKGKSKPKASTRLYHAPLFNIYSNTNVCTGSGDIPSTYNFDDIKKWEDLIFATNYSHTNHNHSLKGIENTVGFWREQQQQSKFDNTLLNPLKNHDGQPVVLEQWFESFSK